MCTRECEYCGEIKPIVGNFTKLGKTCFACKKVKAKIYREATKEQAKQYREANKDKLKANAARLYLERKERDPEKLRQTARDYYARHKDKISTTAKARKYRWDPVKRAEHKERNSAKIKERDKQWRQGNKPHLAAKAAARRAKQKQATPSWADLDVIETFYESAHNLGMLLGEWYHVDHIVPLTSDIVCGLHTQANLQVLLGTENLSKLNRWWPDMPDPIYENKGMTWTPN
jgi:hypothetical protein